MDSSDLKALAAFGGGTVLGPITGNGVWPLVIVAVAAVLMKYAPLVALWLVRDKHGSKLKFGPLEVSVGTEQKPAQSDAPKTVTPKPADTPSPPPQEQTGEAKSEPKTDGPVADTPTPDAPDLTENVPATDSPAKKKARGGKRLQPATSQK